jgi:CBS domain-containing protein
MATTAPRNGSRAWRGDCPWTRKLPVAEDIASSPLIFKKQDPVSNAAGLMLEHNAGGGVVVDGDGQPVGVLTRSDLARFEAERLEAGSPGDGGEDFERVGDWMTPYVVSVRRGTPLWEVLRQMLVKRIHRVFVVDGPRGKKLRGVVTIFDLMSGLAAVCPAVQWEGFRMGRCDGHHPCPQRRPMRCGRVDREKEKGVSHES